MESQEILDRISVLVKAYAEGNHITEYLWEKYYTIQGNNLKVYRIDMETLLNIDSIDDMNDMTNKTKTEIIDNYILSTYPNYFRIKYITDKVIYKTPSEINEEDFHELNLLYRLYKTYV